MDRMTTINKFWIEWNAIFKTANQHQRKCCSIPFGFVLFVALYINMTGATARMNHRLLLKSTLAATRQHKQMKGVRIYAFNAQCGSGIMQTLQIDRWCACTVHMDIMDACFLVIVKVSKIPCVRAQLKCRQFFFLPFFFLASPFHCKVKVQIHSWFNNCSSMLVYLRPMYISKACSLFLAQMKQPLWMLHTFSWTYETGWTPSGMGTMKWQDITMVIRT